MAFAVSRSSKRTRGQYEASNVSQGEDCNLENITVLSGRIDTARDIWNIPDPYGADAPNPHGDGTPENLFSQPANLDFRNKCSYIHHIDDPTGRISVQRNPTNDLNWAWSIMKFYIAHDSSGAGGYPSLHNVMTASITGLAVLGDVRSNGIILTSDDRIKHNEQEVLNGTDLISKLKVKKYAKTSKVYAPNHDFAVNGDGDYVDEDGKVLTRGTDYNDEVGVIAQEVLQIPELEFVVTKPKPNGSGEIDPNDQHCVNYNSLFSVALAAIQELTKRVQELEAVIAPPDLTRQ